MSKRFVLVGFLSFALTTPLFAQDVVGTKKAASNSVFSSSAVDVEYRNYFNQNTDNAANNTDTSLTNHVRANIGFGLFDDFMKTTITLGAYKINDDTAQIYQRRPEVKTRFKGFESAYFDVAPHFTFRPPFNYKEPVAVDKDAKPYASRLQFGAVPTFKAPELNVGIGTLALSSRVEAEAWFSSRQEDLTVTGAADAQTRTRLNLTSKKTSPNNNALLSDLSAKGEQDRPAYEINYVAEAALSADKLAKGLSFTTTVEYYNYFTPQARMTGTDANQSLSNYYDPYRVTITSLAVGYKLNDRLSITDQFSIAHQGFYNGFSNESRVGNDSATTKYQNLLQLKYLLY